jgi:hydroxypyruvate isomerase
MELSASIELIFTEAGDDFGDRVRAAADAGITTVEIWSHSNKDLKSLRKALDACDARVWTLLVESRAPLADRESHKPFVEQVTLACRAAQALGCERIVTGSGVGFPYMKRAQQHAIVVDALKAGAEIAAEHDVILVLENLNTRVDHPGTLFDHTSDCVAAIRDVGLPSLALLYDVYHSLQMRETPRNEIGDNIDLVSHIQIADLPGRTEPGSGTIDWAKVLREIRQLGYDGPVGLEYWPTTESKASLEHIRGIVSAL